jgi:hypothetical protein
MLLDILIILFGLLMYFFSGAELKTTSNKANFNDIYYKTLMWTANGIKYVGLLLAVLFIIKLLIKIF